MKIKKIINNNYCVLSGNEEVIVMGRGIAFNKRVGDSIEEYEIEKSFHLSDSRLFTELQNLLIDSDPKLLEIVHNHSFLIQTDLKQSINDVLYINLLDHLSGAIDRYKEGYEIQNNLVHEIKQFYPQEYRLASDLINDINHQFNVGLTQHEIGFTAMHILNGCTNKGSPLSSGQFIPMIKDILEIIKDCFKMEIDENSISFYRFVTHLKIFSQKLMNNSLYEISFSNQSIMDSLKIKYAQSTYCAGLIKDYLIQKLNHSIEPEEVIYLTIHIQRMITEMKERKGELHE